MDEAFFLSLLRAIISLFIIVDPLGNIPIFVALTSDLAPRSRVAAFKTAVLTGFALLLVFAAAGRWVLEIFDITLYSFKIAGGSLLLILAFELLLRDRLDSRRLLPEESGAVPLGVPLLAGPGAITTTIIILDTMGIWIALISIIIVAVMTWLILKFIDPIYRFLGRVGSTVISKVMAMLIAAIAVQFILEGVSEFLSES